jgi:peptide/nickel transport system substrate-binding protein
VNAKRIPITGVLVTSALLAAGAVVLWQSRGGPATDERATTAQRGGQIVASVRGEPRSFNRFVVSDLTSVVVSELTQGRLVRINRNTFELQPWLADRWESSADGRTHTLHLRPGVTWSDGRPLTTGDVLFSLRAVFDSKVESALASALMVAGQPIRAAAPDAQTVVFTYAAPSGPGVGLLNNLTILPRHKLEAALNAGTLASTWDSKTPLNEIVGTGAFVLRDYQPGQRLVLDRNPRYWRKAADGEALPYLDRVVLEMVPEQNAELLRLQSGATDLTYTELRSEDYVAARRGEEQGQLKVIELGVAPDADAFWFCLKPEVKKADKRFAFVQKVAFRQALSHAVDREAFAETVFLGAAVPIWGPITPGNRLWFWADIPRYPHNVDRAKELLKSIGLEDRNANGIVEDDKGTEARFTIITQRGIGSYDRGTAVLRDAAKEIGVAFDIAPLEFGAMLQRMMACDYDAIYMRPLFSDLDPAGNMDFWLSSGSTHFWNLEAKSPATEWERRIDTLMLEQASATDPERRKQQFEVVQKIFAENLPVLYFAAPRMYYAHSARLRGVVPSVQRPQVLWNADSLSVSP